MHDDQRHKERGCGPSVQLGVMGGVSNAFHSGLGAVDDGENGFFLVGGVCNADVEESCRCLKMIQETRGEAGVLETSLEQGLDMQAGKEWHNDQ